MTPRGWTAVVAGVVFVAMTAVDEAFAPDLPAAVAVASWASAGFLVFAAMLWLLERMRPPAEPEPEPEPEPAKPDRRLWPASGMVWSPDELAEARAEMGLASFEAEYMSRPTCGHEVLVGAHSTPCILTARHADRCDPGDNWLRRHDCQRNGCGRRR